MRLRIANFGLRIAECETITQVRTLENRNRQLAIRNPQFTLFLADRELEHSIGRVERRPHRAINRASGYWTAPEDLNISRFKLGVDKNGYEVLAQSIDMIQIGKRAGEPVRSSLLYRFQSGCRSGL